MGKVVEICGNPFRPGKGGRETAARACSACAGSYEDPDRSAWAPEEGEDSPPDDKEDASGTQES